MSRKFYGAAALAVIGIGAAIWLQKSLAAKHAAVNARAVTDSAKSGSLSSSPIQPSKVAFAGLSDPLGAITRATNRAVDVIKTSLGNNSAAVDYRIRQGNPASAAAAFQSPTQTNMSNYRPSAWAGIQFRSGV
jgi:hypothetical protein